MEMLKKKMETFWKILSEDGICAVCYKLWCVFQKKRGKIYSVWIQSNEKDIKKVKKLKFQPKISIVALVGDLDSQILDECIQSICGQTYKNWEFFIVNTSSETTIKKCLRKYGNQKNIKILCCEKKQKASVAINQAIKLTTGQFITFINCKDIVAPNALYEVARKLNANKELDYIYSDEDSMDKRGKHRFQPFFKPDWSPDTFLSMMYTGHIGVYRKSIGDEIGWLNTEYEEICEYDLALRFTEKTDKIGHISKILYHRRTLKKNIEVWLIGESMNPDIVKKAKKDALQRRGIMGDIEYVKDIRQYRVNYTVPRDVLISVVIPSKDHFEIFARCADSMREKTKFPHYELILVDNGSSKEQKELYSSYCEKFGYSYIYQEMDFNFSRMCNIGAKAAKGDLILFLNDDISIIHGGWMERMAGQALQAHTGAVGAKLLYPDSTLIQHIGVLNFDRGPVHVFLGMDDTPIHYFCRNKIEYNYSAVTAACLMIQKSKFQEVNGFDESYAVAYNDIDFCYKLLEKGYYNVSRMDAVLYHHESLSRGSDVVDDKKMKRLSRERKHLYQEHPKFVANDPFYSPNLTMENIDCEVRVTQKKRKKRKGY